MEELMEIKGLNYVTVTKAGLLDQLNVNREQHAKDYAAAVVEYNQQVVDRLRINLKRAESGNEDKTQPFTLEWGLEIPRQYLEDYDRVISMLTMSVDSTITLTQQEFNQYVRDNWQWQHSFANSTQSYLKK